MQPAGECVRFLPRLDVSPLVMVRVGADDSNVPVARRRRTVRRSSSRDPGIRWLATAQRLTRPGEGNESGPSSDRYRLDRWTRALAKPRQVSALHLDIHQGSVLEPHRYVQRPAVGLYGAPRQGAVGERGRGARKAMGIKRHEPARGRLPQQHATRRLRTLRYDNCPLLVCQREPAVGRGRRDDPKARARPARGGRQPELRVRPLQHKRLGMLRRSGVHPLLGRPRSPLGQPAMQPYWQFNDGCPPHRGRPPRTATATWRRTSSCSNATRDSSRGGKLSHPHPPTRTDWRRVQAPETAPP